MYAVIAGCRTFVFSNILDSMMVIIGKIVFNIVGGLGFLYGRWCSFLK